MANRKFSNLFDISSDIADMEDGGASIIIRMKPKGAITTTQTGQGSTQIDQKAVDTSQVATNIPIPETTLLSTDKTQQQSTEQEAVKQAQTGQIAFIKGQSQTMAQTDQSASQAATNTNLPFPQRPNEANKIVGMVLTPNNEIITDAIIEIKNSKNQSVRTVKTNSLGQFFVSTPLINDSYLLEIKRKGFEFQNLKLNLTGQIVDPVEIRSLK